jgi:hypothetical protein
MKPAGGPYLLPCPTSSADFREIETIPYPAPPYMR